MLGRKPLRPSPMKEAIRYFDWKFAIKGRYKTDEVQSTNARKNVKVKNGKLCSLPQILTVCCQKMAKSAEAIVPINSVK